MRRVFRPEGDTSLFRHVKRGGASGRGAVKKMDKTWNLMRSSCFRRVLGYLDESSLACPESLLRIPVGPQRKDLEDEVRRIPWTP